MTFAVVQDLRKREIANWLNFSLIVFALSFRLFYSIFVQDGFNFFFQGVIGFGIFFLLGNLLYKVKMFAGGDAKLMMALGAVLPIYPLLVSNLKFFSIFFFIFLFSGALYSLFGSLWIASRETTKFKKEFKKQFNLNKRAIYFSLFIAIIFSFLAYIEYMILFFAILIFVSPYLYIYAKAVDEACMVKSVKTKELTEGDWLYRDVRVGRKIIKANWDGLTREQIKQIRKHYASIKVRYGIPFSPAFLISFLALIWFWRKGNLSFLF
jgi:Flp pilus assembly protein protease CpaA